MGTELKDQPGAGEAGDGGQGEESKKGFDELFEEGFSKYEEEQKLAVEAADKEKAKPTEKAKPAEKKEERKPIKILKVQGKEIPVYTEDELVEYAQKGIDYTQKRQADSADRKKWEEEYQGKADELNALGKRFNEIWDRLEKSGFKPAEAKAKAQEIVEKEEAGGSTQAGDDILEMPIEKVYEAYGLDPEFARDHEKKLINDVITMRKTLAQMDGAVKASQKALHFFQVREVIGEMARVIDDERKQNPFDDQVDEATGKSLTLEEFSTLITSKARAVVAQGKKLNLDALTRETIREISTKQSKAKDTVAISDDMSEEDFIKKYPKLAAKLGKTAGQEAVDKAAEKKSSVPPGLDRRAKEVETKRKVGQHDKVRGMADQLEAAFQDDDILSAIKGA